MSYRGGNPTRLAALWALSIALVLPAADRQPVPDAVVEQQTKAEQPKPQPFTSEEREQMAARDEKPGRQVAGGALSNEHLTYIVIALAAAVLVLILK